MRARSCVVPFAIAGAIVALAVACGDMGDAELSGPSANADAGEKNDGGSTSDASFGEPLAANGIFLVHAAPHYPPFRVCFGSALERKPLPDQALMPESNVVGVDVGAAVRIAPFSTAGEVWIHEEAQLRGIADNDCGKILMATNADAVPELKEDLSSGVSLLVLTGCRSAARDPLATVEICGADWTPSAGNLKLVPIRLNAYARGSSMSRLPVQVISLLASTIPPDTNAPKDAGGAPATPLADISVGFGELGTKNVQQEITSKLRFGEVSPSTPVGLAYDPSDTAAYASYGFIVHKRMPSDGGADAGAELLLEQSLADVQRISDPRAVPPDWYAAASSYMLLLLGSPNAKPSADAGVGGDGDAGDARRALHLLAVPLAQEGDEENQADAAAP